MNRPRQTRRPVVHALAAALALLCAALAAPTAGAQETVPVAPETEPVGQETTGETQPEDDYDDELLEPSNTGYIDDAIVGSRLRLRYDSATGSVKPDRAEFIYGKCLCFDKLFGQDAASPGPTENLDFEELELTWEHAFSRRLSLFVEVPFRSAELTIPAGFVDPLGLAGQRLDNSGLGDVRAGMKYALVAGPKRWVTFQLRAYFASGEAQRSLGTDHATIEPGLLYLGRLAKRWTLASELRWWHPLAGSSDPISGASRGDLRREPPTGPDRRVRNDGYAGDILRFGIGASYDARGARLTVSPVAELVGWYVIDGHVFAPGEPLEADNDTIVNLKLGARMRGRGQGSVYLGYGFPLTDDEWYDGIVRLEYRLGLDGRGRRRQHADPARTPFGRAPQRPPKAARAASTDSDATAAARAGAQREPSAAGERAESDPPEAPPMIPGADGRERSPRPSAGRPAEQSAVAQPAPAPPAATKPPPAPARSAGPAALAAVRRWSSAWSGQRLDEYLAAYATGFRPASGLSRPAWEAERRRRLSRPSFIRVSLAEITVTAERPGRVIVEFTQSYESDSYSDTVRKRLVLALEGDSWKILREKSSP